MTVDSRMSHVGDSVSITPPWEAVEPGVARPRGSPRREAGQWPWKAPDAAWEDVTVELGLSCVKKRNEEFRVAGTSSYTYCSSTSLTWATGVLGTTTMSKGRNGMSVVASP